MLRNLKTEKDRIFILISSDLTWSKDHLLMDSFFNLLFWVVAPLNLNGSAFYCVA